MQSTIVYKDPLHRHEQNKQNAQMIHDAKLLIGRRAVQARAEGEGTLAFAFALRRGKTDALHLPGAAGSEAPQMADGS